MRRAYRTTGIHAGEYDLRREDTDEKSQRSRAFLIGTHELAVTALDEITNRYSPTLV